jgi:hypothetical protein
VLEVPTDQNDEGDGDGGGDVKDEWDCEKKSDHRRTVLLIIENLAPPLSLTGR